MAWAKEQLSKVAKGQIPGAKNMSKGLDGVVGKEEPVRDLLGALRTAR